MARGNGLISVQQLDLTRAQAVPAQGDLCLCLEVAEHIPRRHVRHLCQLLSTVAPILVFTAAIPGQGGYFHVNEQSQSYWIDLMKAVGMEHDVQAVRRIRDAFEGKMIPDYDRNLMIFRKASGFE